MSFRELAYLLSHDELSIFGSELRRPDRVIPGDFISQWFMVHKLITCRSPSVRSSSPTRSLPRCPFVVFCPLCLFLALIVAPPARCRVWPLDSFDGGGGFNSFSSFIFSPSHVPLRFFSFSERSERVRYGMPNHGWTGLAPRGSDGSGSREEETCQIFPIPTHVALLISISLHLAVGMGMFNGSLLLSLHVHPSRPPVCTSLTRFPSLTENCLCVCAICSVLWGRSTTHGLILRWQGRGQAGGHVFRVGGEGGAARQAHVTQVAGLLCPES